MQQMLQGLGPMTRFLSAISAAVLGLTDGTNAFASPQRGDAFFQASPINAIPCCRYEKKKTCLKKNILAALDLACFSERVLPFHQPPAEIWKYGRNE